MRIKKLAGEVAGFSNAIAGEVRAHAVDGLTIGRARDARFAAKEDAFAELPHLSGRDRIGNSTGINPTAPVDFGEAGSTVAGHGDAEPIGVYERFARVARVRNHHVVPTTIGIAR